MERLSLRDRVPNHINRKRTGVAEAFERVGNLKWNTAGHVARVRSGR